MDEFTIEKNVPLPEKNGKGLGKWQRLIQRMAVGDSVALPERQSICLYHAIKNLGGKSARRKTNDLNYSDEVPEGETIYRVWLTEAVKLEGVE